MRPPPRPAGCPHRGPGVPHLRAETDHYPTTEEEAERVPLGQPRHPRGGREKAQDAGVVIQKAGKVVYITTEVPPEFLGKQE